LLIQGQFTRRGGSTPWGLTLTAAPQGKRTEHKTTEAETRDRFDNAEAEGEGVIIVPFQLLRALSKGTGTETVVLENDGADITVTNNVGGHAITRTVPGTEDADWPASGAAITTSESKCFLQAYRRKGKRWTDVLAAIVTPESTSTSPRQTARPSCRRVTHSRTKISRYSSTDSICGSQNSLRPASKPHQGNEM
jgi:hypothetical protein